MKATLWTFVALAMLSYGPMLAIHAACISGKGFWEIAGVELFVLVPMLALLVAVGALAALLFKRARAGALRVLFVAGGLVVLFVPTVWAGTSLRSYGFRLAATRAEPLVAAIKRYEQENGSPPEMLEDLVPRYLPELPAGLPPLEIVTGEKAATRYEGNPWVLTAPVGTGFLNWDQFMYFPKGNYPKVGYGGWIERVGEWAYVHE